MLLSLTIASSDRCIEDARLAALRMLEVLDSDPIPELDIITRLAADRFDAPIALVSLVDEDRQCFISKYGLDVTSTNRKSSFCAHAIADDKVLVISDAHADERFANNALVVGPPNIRFYAGAPLVLESGHRIGTLCVIDRKARRRFSERERNVLKLMASQVLSILQSHRLLQQQKISQLIAATTTDAFVCADAESRIVLWNRAAEAMFGWSEKEAIGESLDLIIPDRHRAGHHSGVARLRAKGPTKLVGRTVEVTAICKSGSELPVELSLAMWPSEGEPGGFAAIIRDISARKQAELERAATDAKLAQQFAAIEASNDGIALTGTDGLFVFMNRAHAQMFGFSDPSELIGQPWSALYEPPEAERIQSFVMPVLASIGQWRGETLGRRRDGSPIAQEIVLSLAPDGGIVCVTRDIAARQAMEREKVRLREQLMLAQRQEAVGQLASGIAHDFNNLIAVIAGTADLLRVVDDDRVQHHAARICSATDTAAGLVDKLLNLSRRIPNYESIDINRVVRDVSSLVVPSLTYPGHTIEIVPSAQTLIAEADATELMQVVLNLAINARDALSSGIPGRIRLEIFDAKGYEQVGTVLLGSIPRVPSAVIRVNDTGCGIYPETISRIFDPFFTHKGNGGTGLGLAVVAGILSSNGGAIAVQSTLGHGTTFEVWWPLQVARSGADSNHTLGWSPDLSLAGKAVLIVDDNQPVLETLAGILEQAGAEVAPCIDPTDALDAVRENTSAWDLVLTDYDMPGMNGAQLARRLREIRPDLPIMLLSALPRVSQSDQEVLGLFDVAIGKPVSADRLIEAAARAITGVRHLQAERGKQ